MNKKFIAILGMHRSGTSAMAGLFHKLGFNMGELPPSTSTEDNTKGHYEHGEFVGANTTNLGAVGTDWHLNLDKNFVMPPLNLNPYYSEMVVNLKNLIDNNIGTNTNFVVKDPRISCLLPVYYQALTELSSRKYAVPDKCIESYFIIMRRPHQEIADSLHKRNPNFISIEQGLDLSEKYYHYIDKYTSEGYFNRASTLNFNPLNVDVDFKSFLKNPIDIIRKIEELFNFQIIQSNNQIKLIEEFIDPNLRRSKIEN